MTLCYFWEQFKMLDKLQKGNVTTLKSYEANERISENTTLHYIA
jgi:hypothetical protein